MNTDTSAPVSANAAGAGPGGAGLEGAVVIVAGAGGPAGQATSVRLVAAGATVVATDADAERLAVAVEAARAAAGDNGGEAVARPADLLDLDATAALVADAEREFGQLDGLVHLVGGWRGSKGFADLDLADWDLLEKLLIRTLQNTSLAAYDALARSDRGRFVLVSAAAASKPTAGNAAYAAAKAAAEAWTLALADDFRKTGGEDGPAAAATILVVKALLTDAMRAAKPEAKFPGFTHVDELAEAVAGLWSRPTAELNGTRLWLTEQP